MKQIGEHPEYCIDCPCGHPYWADVDTHCFECNLFQIDLEMVRTPDGGLEPERCAECLYRRPQIGYSRSHSDFVNQGEKL